MVFSKKRYVFETKDTRFSRKLKNFLTFLATSFIVYSIICFILLLVSKQESKESKEFFFKRSPDIIIVFTGDKGRIPYAIKRAKEYNQSNLLISGVNARNTVPKLLKNINSQKLNLNYLDLDYNSKNTLENVRESIRYIRKDPALTKALIISHDYHILRIKAIVNYLRRDSDQFTVYYQGVNTDLSKIRNLKILYKEAFKFFRTIAYIWLADID